MFLWKDYSHLYSDELFDYNIDIEEFFFEILFITRGCHLYFEWTQLLVTAVFFIRQTIHQTRINPKLWPFLKAHRTRTHKIFDVDLCHHVLTRRDVYLSPLVHIYVRDISCEIVQLSDCIFDTALYSL